MQDLDLEKKLFTKRKKFRWIFLSYLLAACTTPSIDEDVQVQQQVLGTNPEVDPAKLFVFTDLSIVEDPVRTTCSGPKPADCGVWTFAKMMSSLAGTSNYSRVSIITEFFLRSWIKDQEINTFTIQKRDQILPMVIQSWKDNSGTSGKLDFSKAPFRLLSIVNRMDLRKKDKDGNYNSAGEGRFVFGVVDGDGNALPFTIIFEYNLAASECEHVKSWAMAWGKLHSMEFDDHTSEIEGGFNEQLELITRHFTSIGIAKNRPNGSAINQVRTNEIALDSPWELREFTLQCPPSLSPVDTSPLCKNALLRPTTVKQTPDASLANSELLSDFINRNEAAILDGTYNVPEKFNGEPLLGGSAPTPTSWTPPGINNPVARDIFALNTCNGCHGNETSTSFLHIETRPTGSESGLSTWLDTLDIPRRIWI